MIPGVKWNDWGALKGTLSFEPCQGAGPPVTRGLNMAQKILSLARPVYKTGWLKPRRQEPEPGRTIEKQLRPGGQGRVHM